MDNERMSIVECEDRAKDEGFNTATFEAVGPNGRMKCRWVDAYFGAFSVEGQSGVMYTHEAKHTFRNLGLHCENFQANA